MKKSRIKRWLSAFLCACMVAMTVPCAFAADEEVTDPVAKIGEQGYTTLEEAIASAKDGDTITLLKNIDLETDRVYLNKNVTLDLAGHELTSANTTCTVLSVAGGAFTDSIGGGKVENTAYDKTNASGSNFGIAVVVGNDRVTFDNVALQGNYAIFTQTSGETVVTNCKLTGLAVGVGILGASSTDKKTTSVTINEGTEIVARDFGISGNGNYDYTKIMINGGTITSENLGIYHPQVGDLTISGGEITAPNGIQYCGAGAFNISGDAKITATGPYTEFPQKPSAQGDGSTDDGVAIALISRGGGWQASDEETMKVNISGGTLTSQNNAAIAVYRLQQVNGKWVTNENTSVKNYLESLNITGGKFYGSNEKGALDIDSASKASVSISDGQFSSDVTKYCVSGKMAQWGEDGLYSIVDIPNLDEGQIKNTVGDQQQNESSVGKDIAEDDKAAAKEVAKNVGAALTDAAETVTASKKDADDVVDVLFKQGKITLTDGKINEDVTFEVQPYLDVTTETYNIQGQQLKLDITPKYDVVAYTEQMGENAAVTVSEGNVMTVNTPTEVTITLPDGFVTSETQKIYVKHEKNGRTYLYNGTLTAPAEGQSQYILSFTSEHGFSPFTVTTSLPVATITKNGVTTAYDSLQDAANAAASDDEIVLNSGEKHTLNFTETKSVKVTNRTGTQITVAFNGEDKLIENEKSETFSYTKPSSGGSSGGGSGTTTYPVTVLSADNGNVNASPSNAAKGKIITITVTPDKGYELDTLTAADGSGKAVELTKKSDATYTFTMPASSVKVSASFAKVKQSFDDVKNDDWFAKAVDYAVDQGMMNGVGGNKFAPDAATTRGMIVTVLYRLEGEPSVGSAAFADVHDGEYYAKAVAWASANGIVNGYGNGKFGPNDAITREQFAAILYRYAKYKGYDVSVGESTNILSYADAQSISEYAVPAFQWSCGAGVMNGSNGKLLPKANATRAQAAQLLMNFCENAAK